MSKEILNKLSIDKKGQLIVKGGIKTDGDVTANLDKCDL